MIYTFRLMEILSCLRPKNVRGLVALFIYKLQQIYSRFRKLRIQLKDHNESFIFHEKKIQIALLLLCCILSSFVGISFLEFVNFKRKQRHVVQGLSLAMLLGKKNYKHTRVVSNQSPLKLQQLQQKFFLNLEQRGIKGLVRENLKYFTKIIIQVRIQMMLAPR